MQTNIKIKVRDMRRREKFQVDDAYLNGYARLCGIYATGVYMSLCRHANFHTQECWPTIETIENELNVSEFSVLKAIAILQLWNIISVTKEKDEKGRQKVNIYTLIDKSEWKAKPEIQVPVRDSEIDNDKSRPRGTRSDNENSRPRATNEPTACGEVGADRVGRGVRLQRIQIQGYKKNTSAPDGAMISSETDVSLKADSAFISGSERGGEAASAEDLKKEENKSIGDIIDAFKEVNPMYKSLFYRKSERDASARLLEVVGKEPLLEIISILQQTNQQEYAPRITTPCQLQEKLGKLQIFVRQFQQKMGISVEELLK